MDCDLDQCITCDSPVLETNADGVCEDCANLDRRLALMARGVTRDPRTGLTTITTTKESHV